jgi:hypothetical protein
MNPILTHRQAAHYCAKIVNSEGQSHVFAGAPQRSPRWNDDVSAGEVKVPEDRGYESNFR